MKRGVLPLDGRLLMLRTRLREIRAELVAARALLGVAAGGLLAGVAVLGLWLIGHLGFRLGTTSMLALPELESAGGGLATGVRMVSGAPGEVYRASLDDPARLIVAFVAVAVPAALLPMAILFGPGDSAGRDSATRRLGHAVAPLAMIAAVLTVAWIAAPFRVLRLTPLPADAEAAAAWLAGRSTVAGLDALVAVSSVVWVVLVLQLDLPRWLRRLAGTFAVGAAAAMVIAASASNGAAVELDRPLARIRLSSDGADAAILGQVMGGPALLRRVGTTSVVELQAVPRGVVVGRTSLREVLTEPAEPGRMDAGIGAGGQSPSQRP